MYSLQTLFREIERYMILPLRFLRVHFGDCRNHKQKCKVCGQADGFDFHVPDDIWEKIVPARFRNRVVCLRCFDRFARERGVDYTHSLSLCFVGSYRSFDLKLIHSINGGMF